MSFATLALLASAIIGVESPDGSYARNYAFPITGNGSLVLGVDPEGDQMQTLPLPRMHAPEIVWEGRRYARAVNRAALLSMGHWNTRESPTANEKVNATSARFAPRAPFTRLRTPTRF